MTALFAAHRFAESDSATRRVAVAVSACLAGEPVRYDGADKKLPAFARLQQELALVTICPEVGAGLPIPRPPVQLVAENDVVLARGRDDRTLDVTQRLQRYARDSLDRLRNQYALCGYLWKSRSPSCGLGSTPLHDTSGHQVGTHSGVQAALFAREMPWLCHCEETALVDDAAVYSFVLRCRLTFDIMHTGIPLPTLRRHYEFLTALLPAQLHERMINATEQVSKEDYLAALQWQCGQMEPKDLLRLFSD